MSIAGYDPSGGAGVLADVKVFEQHKVYGFAVITSNTLQNDSEIKAIDWIPVEDIIKQIDVILEKFEVTVFKIGIVEDSQMLIELKKHVLSKNPETKIIWDPVLMSSSGFKVFANDATLKELLENIYLVTPNLPEFEKLFGSSEKAFEISATTAVYLKGGHNEHAQKGVDELFFKGEKITFHPEGKDISSKHGSGCILSSSIAANIALGMDIKEACKKAKAYTEHKLSSNKSLLAYHH
jgi:hydroxymethylpyrimidine/phosphomethylpyrimidine kinase